MVVELGHLFPSDLALVPSSSSAHVGDEPSRYGLERLVVRSSFLDPVYNCLDYQRPNANGMRLLPQLA